MSNFWQRLLTGIVFLVVLISGIIYSQWTFAVLFAAVDQADASAEHQAELLPFVGHHDL